MNETTKSNPPGVAKALSAIGNTALAIGLIIFVLSILAALSKGDAHTGAVGFALLITIALFAAVPLGLSYLIRAMTPKMGGTSEGHRRSAAGFLRDTSTGADRN